MGEKYTNIRVGVPLDMMPPCPHEDGWAEWMYESRRLTNATGRPTVNGVRIEASYEGKPKHIGARVAVLNYGETWIHGSVKSMGDWHQAIAAWEIFRGMIHDALGLYVPSGRLIISHDE